MSLLLTSCTDDLRPLNGVSAVQIEQEARAHQYQYWLVSCAKAQKKSQVLHAIAQGLGFPAHFGQNFDALSDCLTDLGYEDTTGLVIVLDQLPDVPYFSHNDQEVLFDVFRDAMAYFKEQKIPCYVFYQFHHQDAEKK